MVDQQLKLDILTSLKNDQDLSMDEYIIQFFGSEEEARKKLHLYALETDTKFDRKTENGVMKYEATVEYYLRLKTPEELTLDQANENINHYLDAERERIELDEDQALVDDMWKPEDER